MENVLPLPLTVFERYMLADDRPSHPMTFFIKMKLSGRFDRTALTAALATAVERHPMFAARVADGQGRRPTWIPADSHELPPIYWNCQTDRQHGPRATGIDVRAEPGLRLWVDETTEETTLTAQFHHVCCDGIGAVQFLDDLYCAYDVLVNGVAPELRLRPLDPRRLRERGRFDLTWADRFKRLHKECVGLLGARQFLFRKPVAIEPTAGPQALASGPLDYISWRTHTLDVTELASLRATAKAAGVSFNDLMARDLFLALAEWLARHGQDCDKKWIRLSVPVCLRTIKDLVMPSTNVVSMVFLERRRRDLANPAQLLQGIHDEMQLIKRMRLGLTFVNGLAIASLLPGVYQRMANNDGCRATALMSNVGDTAGWSLLEKREGRIVSGNLLVEGAATAAPLRPKTALSFAGGTYAKRMLLTLSYDPRVVAEAHAGELLAGYVEQLRDSARGAKQ